MIRTNILLSLLFFITITVSSLEASTYYIDNNGSNDTDCKSKDYACTVKHFNYLNSNALLKLIAGDSVLFKRGQRFYISFSFNDLNGTLKQPISFLAYGEGEKPILTGIKKIYPNWHNEGNGQWSIPLKVKTSRVWYDGKEQKYATLDESGLNIIWRWKNKKFYFSSVSKPKEILQVNSKYYIFYFKNSSYINIENLNIIGGTNASIQVSNSRYLNVKNSIIGKNAGYGIVIKNSSDITIERNIIDSNFKLKYRAPLVSKEGNQGVHDGIDMRGEVSNVEISYNDFINWGHAGFMATTKDPKGIAYNRIHHNYFTAKDLAYGRAITYSGNTHHNEIHHNYIENIKTQNQLNGHDNYFHHNIIDNVKNTELKKGQQGNGISIEDYALSTYNNRIIHNSISNTQGAGIAFIALGKQHTKEHISSNTIGHNYFLNCGSQYIIRNGKKHKNRFRAIYLPHYSDVKGQYFYDNAIVSDFNQTVYYRKEYLSIKEFNKKNQINKNGDKIKGNSSIFNPNTHGAGDKNEIRKNTGSTAPF